jgi:hypothetical protein
MTTSPPRTYGPQSYPTGVFSLLETGIGGVPRAIYFCDVTVQMFAPFADSWAGLLIDQASIPFTELTCQYCPAGAEFYLDVT